MFDDFLIAIAMFSSISYAIGYQAGKYGGFIELFDVSNEFKQSVHQFLNKLLKAFFGEDIKKDDLSDK